MILTLTDMFHKILHGIMWYPCTMCTVYTFLHWEGIMWNTHAVCTLYLDYSSQCKVLCGTLMLCVHCTSAITHGRCILHNSTICCGILWNCIFIVVLYGCSSKFHNCGTLWNEPFFVKLH